VAFMRPDRVDWNDWLVWPDDSLMGLGCLYCKQTQRAFTVLKNTKKWLKIGSVDEKLFKFQLTRVWELLTMPGTERDVAFSQLAVKGLKCSYCAWQHFPVFSKSKVSAHHVRTMPPRFLCVCGYANNH
jgi:hypothetical protein